MLSPRIRATCQNQHAQNWARKQSSFQKLWIILPIWNADIALHRPFQSRTEQVIKSLHWFGDTLLDPCRTDAKPPAHTRRLLECIVTNEICHGSVFPVLPWPFPCRIFKVIDYPSSSYSHTARKILSEKLHNWTRDLPRPQTIWLPLTHGVPQQNCFSCKPSVPSRSSKISFVSKSCQFRKQSQLSWHATCTRGCVFLFISKAELIDDQVTDVTTSPEQTKSSFGVQHEKCLTLRNDFACRNNNVLLTQYQVPTHLSNVQLQRGGLWGFLFGATAFMNWINRSTHVSSTKKIGYLHEYLTIICNIFLLDLSWNHHLLTALFHWFVVEFWFVVLSWFATQVSWSRRTSETQNGTEWSYFFTLTSSEIKVEVAVYPGQEIQQNRVGQQWLGSSLTS